MCSATIYAFSTCRELYRGERDQGAIITVDFTQCLNTERAMKLSEIADTVEYLELKTPKEIIISRIGDVIYADGYWIVRSLGGISKFTKEGDWVQQIGRKGQGPGEYLGVRGIDFDPIRKEILVADAQQILFYDLDGNYIRNVKMVDDYFYNIGITDSVLWTGALGLHQEKHQVYAFNYKKDTLAFFPNPNYGVKVKNTDGVYFAHSRMEKEFYRYNGELYLKNRPANDTVFRLSSSNRTPYIVFDMGKYKLPIEYESWYSNEDYEKYASAYWGIPAVAEDDRFLFLLARRRFGLSKIDVKAIFDFVSEHIQYPKDALEAEKQGTVICEFVINKDGSISEIKVKRGLYPSLDKEAVRVIGSFPKWHPGKQEGKKVRVLYALPIVFRIR